MGLINSSQWLPLGRGKSRNASRKNTLKARIVSVTFFLKLTFGYMNVHYIVIYALYSYFIIKKLNDLQLESIFHVLLNIKLMRLYKIERTVDSHFKLSNDYIF